MQQSTDDRGGILLSQLLHPECSAVTADPRINACCSQAAQCQPGDLFFAIVEPERDGHDEAQEAVRRGAVAVVAEQLLPVSAPTYVVDDTRQLYGRACQQLAGQPSDRLTTIGVTGTNGKTTIVTLLASILRAAHQTTATSSTIGRYDGVRQTEAVRTTPRAAELASWLARSEAHGCRCAVIEASSQGLAERRLSGVGLDAVILTNLRRDHVDFHGTTANYRKAKKRIFELLKQDGFAVLNADDPGCAAAAAELDCPYITFGRRQPAEVTAHVVERFQGEQTFLLSAGTETVPVRTRMIGDHHVSNCLAAAATGLVAGLPLTTIARGLEAVEQISHRLDRVECGQEFGVFVDCADTPDRLAISLRAVRQVTPGRVICLLSADPEERKSERPMLGRISERSADVGVITAGSVSDRCDLTEIAHDILDGYERPAAAHVIPTRTHAIRWALEQAQPGDSVLIAGAAPDTRSTNSRFTSTHNDFEFARHCLYGSSSVDGPSLVASGW